MPNNAVTTELFYTRKRMIGMGKSPASAKDPWGITVLIESPVLLDSKTATYWKINRFEQKSAYIVAAPVWYRISLSE